MDHDVDLDLGKLFKYVLKKWWIIAIIAIICCLIGGVIGYKKSASKSIETAETIQKEKEEKLKDTKKALERLTSEEISEVDKLVELDKYREKTFKGLDFADKENVEHQNYLNSVFTQTYNSLSKDQELYYETFLPEEEEEESSGTKTLLKWALIGLLAGGFVGILIVALPYILSDKIRSKSDLYQAYGLLDLDTIENAMQVVEKRGFKAVCLLGDPITRDGYTFSSVMNADSVILSYTIDKSTFSKIDNDIFTAQQYGLPIIGYIVKENVAGN